MQQVGGRADLGRALVGEAHAALELLAAGRGEALRLAPELGELDFQRRERLAGGIVQIPPDSPPLLVLEPQQLGRDPPQLLLGALAHRDIVYQSERQRAAFAAQAREVYLRRERLARVQALVQPLERAAAFPRRRPDPLERELPRGAPVRLQLRRKIPGCEPDGGA